MEGAFLIEAGRLFQNFGPATSKDLAPVQVLFFGSYTLCCCLRSGDSADITHSRQVEQMVRDIDMDYIVDNDA